MKELLLGLILLFSCVIISAQVVVTTEDGKKVLLKEDGTWEYVNTEESKVQIPLTEIFLGTKRLKATQEEPIYSKGDYDVLSYYGKREKYIMTALISMQLAVDNGKIIIIFWLKKESGKVKNLYITHALQGDIMIYLDAGEAIRLIDREYHGIVDGDLYTIRNLTSSECQRLKQHGVVSMSVLWPTYESINNRKNFDTEAKIGDHLKALGK